MARPFPPEWFSPTEEARRAVAALAEGFCPFPQCGYPFDEGSSCPVCKVTWSLHETGLSGQVSYPDGSSLTVIAYPFGRWRQPVTGLG